MALLNTSVSLGEHFARFTQQKVREGRYGSVSEVIREGLRLVEEREARMDIVRQKLIEAENSGAGREFDFAAFKLSMRASRVG